MGASLKDHLAAQISSQQNIPELKQSSRNNFRDKTVGGGSQQALNLTARSSNTHRTNNNLLIDQIASARLSMKEDQQQAMGMAGNETPIIPMSQANKVVNKIGARMANKRRMLAVGDPDELTGVRITDGHAYDRYERKPSNKYQ